MLKRLLIIMCRRQVAVNVFCIKIEKEGQSDRGTEGENGRELSGRLKAL